MDMRTKQYPNAPPMGPERPRLIRPSQGDLRLRSLSRTEFIQQFFIHADPRQHQLYKRFIFLRRFIVMSDSGDMYMMPLMTSMRMEYLPHQSLLALPLLGPWDIVTVLDLVYCSHLAHNGHVMPNLSWELVRVRWRNGVETWLPTTLVEVKFPHLLQEFYVNSINSWAYHQRVSPHSLAIYRTEVELWLHHDELQPFYQWLRRRRERGESRDVKPQIHPSPTTQQREATHPPFRIQPDNAQPSQSPPYAQPQVNRISEPNHQATLNLSTTNEENGSLNGEERSTDVIQVDTPQRQDSQEIAAEVSIQHDRILSPEKHSSGRSRIRKRLKNSQVEAQDDDEDDDILELTEKSNKSTSAHSLTHQIQNVSVSNNNGSNSTQKHLKRLRKPVADVEYDDEMEEVLLPNQTAKTTSPQYTPSRLSEASTSPQPISPRSADVSVELSINDRIESTNDVGVADGYVQDRFEDDEVDDDGLHSELTPIIIGEIRCICGANSVDAYAGRWLQCWNEECAVWEHADCVGSLNQMGDQTDKYICSKCDHVGYTKRYAHAKSRLIDWMFQCCDSRNSTQLLRLIHENSDQTTKKYGWKHPRHQNMTLLMKAARCGLIRSVRYLVEQCDLDVFTTDLLSFNALHHAALGESLKCTRFLVNHEPKLLEHQDLMGRTPFHFMLQSTKLNEICVPYLTKSQNLAAAGDFESNLPIHYACQAINKWTVEICRLILSIQPSMMFEKSSDGLVPVLILCRASSRRSPPGEVAECIKEIIRMMLEIDIFGTFLSLRDSRGWTVLHFAAAAGNHEVLAVLLNTKLVAFHAVTNDGKLTFRYGKQTALHIAAKSNHHLCVRLLIDAGLNITARDSFGWIPMLYAEKTSCLQEFMHYKVTKQLSRLCRMITKRELQEVIEQWQRRIILDPTCFDILNDWCQCELERIERMDSLLLNNSYMLRLDNKIDYITQFILPSVKEAPALTEGTTRKKKLNFVFSTKGECFWKQFVQMGRQLDPEDFRNPMRFLIDRRMASERHFDDEINMKLVLIRLSAALRRKEPNLLARYDDDAVELSPPVLPDEEARERLVDYYVLGELVAHLVLFCLPMSGIFDFSSSFLQCAVGGKGSGASDVHNAEWSVYAQSFAGGFEHVLPATLHLLHVDDFRVLINGPEAYLNARTINWDTTIDWSALPPDSDIQKWWTRLVNELVEEEQQLLLLWLAQTYHSANQKFFLTDDAATIRVGRFPPPESDDVEMSFEAEEEFDSLLPYMDRTANILHLPLYSCYEAFKKVMVTVLRHSNRAFLPR